MRIGKNVLQNAHVESRLKRREAPAISIEYPRALNKETRQAGKIDQTLPHDEIPPRRKVGHLGVSGEKRGNAATALSFCLAMPGRADSMPGKHLKSTVPGSPESLPVGSRRRTHRPGLVAISGLARLDNDR